MARRRNAIAHRFARMKGLPPDEKALMQRIAHLIDAALNNRQASNPSEGSQSRGNRQIYPPTGLLVKEGIKSVKLIWDAPPSNALLRYEIIFDNLTTGERTVKSSFTSFIQFKAAAGTYIARISSVGRDGSSSPVKQVQFSIGEDVMQIEGAKNGPLELGTIVQDNILLIAGYSVYVWGSAVLDKYIAGASNNKMVLRLWRSEVPDADFATDSPVLQETITLYPATEAASNLDSTARAGLITRPSGGIRQGSFDTSQSVMFSPLAVASVDDHKNVTYFLQAINRETEADEVCLSQVMWAGANSDSASIPGDPFTPPPDYVFPNLNSFHTQKVGLFTIDGAANIAMDTRSMWGTVDREHMLIGNQWTIAMWVRFDDLNVSRLAGDPTANEPGNPNGGTIEILTRGAMRNDQITAYNSIRISLAGNIAATPDLHQLDVRVGDIDGITVKQWRARADITGGFEEDASSGLFTWGGATSGTAATNDAWYFLVVCFSGGTFTGGVPKVRVYLNSTTAITTTKLSTAGTTPAMALINPISDTTTAAITMDDNHTMAYNLAAGIQDNKGGNYKNGIYTGNLRYINVNNFQIHQFGMWNVCLDALGIGQGASIEAIKTLFNEGHGTKIDWRENILNLNAQDVLIPAGSYFQAENLIHLIQFGAVEQPMVTGFPGRDTGNPLFQGDLNMTGTSARFQGDDMEFSNGTNPSGLTPPLTNTNEHFTDNTTIADVLSPTGSNGTTQFDFSYPGQNQIGGTG